MKWIKVDQIGLTWTEVGQNGPNKLNWIEWTKINLNGPNKLKGQN